MLPTDLYLFLYKSTRRYYTGSLYGSTRRYYWTYIILQDLYVYSGLPYELQSLLIFRNTRTYYRSERYTFISSYLFFRLLSYNYGNTQTSTNKSVRHIIISIQRYYTVRKCRSTKQDIQSTEQECHSTNQDRSVVALNRTGVP